MLCSLWSLTLWLAGAAPEVAPSTARPPGTAPEALRFREACRPGPVVTIAAIGDVLMHDELQRQAYAAPDHFLNLWSAVIDLIARADLSYANLEVPIAPGLTHKGPHPDPGLHFDNQVYSGYPNFNAHPQLAADLAATGIDVVSTANNHALDRGPEGIARSLDALDQAGIAHAGSRRAGTSDPLYALTEAQGVRIAWIGCTLHTNFAKDHQAQVLHCFSQRRQLLQLVAQLSATDNIDGVIVTPHWGKEYSPQPQAKQRQLAQALVDAGATAILGTHPHVLQPWEILRDAAGREALVLYSLGNFAHHQRSLPRRSSIIAYLALGRGAAGKLVPMAAGYVPISVRMEGDRERFFVEAIDRVGGPADARALVVDMYGPGNLLDADAPLALPRHCPAAAPAK